MQISTPTEITSVAWEGELVAPAVIQTPKSPTRLTATIGQPAIWTVAEALENEVGQKWTPPLGDADYWLVRLACTLRNPSGRQSITEAEQRLYLRPQNKGSQFVYAVTVAQANAGGSGWYKPI